MKKGSDLRIYYPNHDDPVRLGRCFFQTLPIKKKQNDRTCSRKSIFTSLTR
jgi:hypothetical protein